MASGTAVWGIDVGQCALKAIKLRQADDGKLEVVAFDIIEHPKILSQPDADRDELIKGALEKFASRNEWQKDKIVVGIPGQQTFSRFTKLPPADPKKLNDLVKYEAGQQIPFDMDDVVWDYQIFQQKDVPDIEVGIFAVRKDIIRKQLEYFTGVKIAPVAVQTVPTALYNFATFDKQATEGGATILIDVGAQNTDLIIVEPNSCWTRNIPLGGNAFTETLVRSFKLSFAKAESLKRSAAESKYARQIFQAMRPVFAELVAEIQRSIGFYSSTHRDVELTKVVALGNAFLLPGLQKYLENNLTVGGGVVKLEKFNQIVPSATVNAPQFTDNVLSFAAAYGLAVQGLGLAKITSTLLPPELARIAVWRKKQPLFAAAAAIVGLASVQPFLFTMKDAAAADGDPAVKQKIDQIVSNARKLSTEYKAAVTDTKGKEDDIKGLLDLRGANVRIIPYLLSMIHEPIPPLNPPALNNATTREEFEKLIKSDPVKFARKDRGMLIIESVRVTFQEAIDDVLIGTNEEGLTGGETFGEDAPMAVGPRGGIVGDGGGGGRGARGGGSGGGGGAGERGAPASANKANKVEKKQSTGDVTPGFLVEVRAKLVYGETKTEAQRWLDTYLPALKKCGQRPGMGFFIPLKDPTDPLAEYVTTKPVIKEVVTGRSGLSQARRDFGQRDVDPVTGEPFSADWHVYYGFKVKLGDLPKEAGDKPEADATKKPAESRSESKP